MAVTLQSTDNAPFGSTAGAGGEQATNTTAITVDAGTDRALAVLIEGEGDGTAAGAEVSSMTYNGVALTQLARVEATAWSWAEIWGLAAPATGSNNLVITLNEADNFNVKVLVATGVDQTTPFRTGVTATGTGTSGTATVASVATDDLVFAILGLDGTGHNPTPGANETEVMERDSTIGGTEGAAYTQPGSAGGVMSPGSVTPWTTSCQYSLAASAFRAVAGGTDATVTGVPADGTGTFPAPAVTADSAVTTPPADGTGAFPAPTVSGTGDGTVTTPAADGTGDLPDPTVTAGSNVTTPAASGTGDFPAAAMDISSTVTTGPGSGTGQFPAPTVAGTGDGTVTAPPADGTGDLPAPAVTAAANVTGVPADGTGAFPAPTVTGDAPPAGPAAPRTRLPSRVSSLVRLTDDKGTVRTTVMTGTARITTHNVQVWTLTLNATTRTSTITGQGVGSRVVPHTRVTSTADG